MLNINDKVKITDKNSCFYNETGIILNKGNGNMWQIMFNNSYGIYFEEKVLEKVYKEV